MIAYRGGAAHAQYMLCARITERLPKILKIFTRNTESTMDWLGGMIAVYIVCMVPILFHDIQHTKNELWVKFWLNHALFYHMETYKVGICWNGFDQGAGEQLNIPLHSAWEKLAPVPTN